MSVIPFASLVSSANTNTSTANAAATVTYAASSNTPKGPASHVIGGVSVSYRDGSPANGVLSITDGGTTVFTLDLPDGEIDRTINFDPPLAGTAGQALVVNLSAGGASVIGKVNVHSHWLQ